MDIFKAIIDELVSKIPNSRSVPSENNRSQIKTEHGDFDLVLEGDEVVVYPVDKSGVRILSPKGRVKLTDPNSISKLFDLVGHSDPLP